MRYLLFLPLFFLSGLSYSTPDCETLKIIKDKARADLYQASAMLNKARAELDKARADYKKHCR